MFPQHRSRRLRRTAGIRRLVRETSLAADDLICPVFLASGENVKSPLASLPGVDMLSGTPLEAEARLIQDLGIPAVLLFAIAEESAKDEAASLAWSASGPMQQAIPRIKRAAPELVVIADLCLCEYHSLGHCGLLTDGEIDNDRTLQALQRAAVSLAESGADVIAPSGVMDGTVQALRSALDAAGRQRTLTMPYSAKFASALYGPFKDATHSAPAESKHATHQVEVANGRQAIEKIRTDIDEGADMVIIKPALAYLDIVTRARDRFDVPVAAYNVSGEYNMILACAPASEAARETLTMESLTCIKRAGADMIITYFAKAAARVLATSTP